MFFGIILKIFFFLFQFFFFIFFYFLSLILYNKIKNYLFFGGLLSCIMSSFILLSYYQIIPWRKHPSPLIYYRSLSHFFFSIIIMINSFSNAWDNPYFCSILSFLTQFTFFTGESWLLIITIDLFLSLTNPFTSYTSNLYKYHLIIWITGFLNAFSLILSNSCQGVFGNSVCWISVDNLLSSCLWGYYLSWYEFNFIIYLIVNRH